MSWFRRAGRSTALALHRRDLWPVALAGFLVRGGIVPLLLPILVLPTVIQIAGIVLVEVFQITGQLTTQAIVAIVVATVAVLVWLVAAGLFGAAVDATLVRAGSARTIRSAAIWDQVAIRAALLIPLLIVLAIALVIVEQTAVTELLTPSTLTTYIVARVVGKTAPALIVLAVVWLLTEALAAIAIRYALRDGMGTRAALAATARHLVRRPVTATVTVAAALAGSLVAIGVPLAATAAAFEWCRVLARSAPIAFTIRDPAHIVDTTRDARPLLVFLAAAVLAAAWLATLVAAAVASAWRSFLFTAEVDAEMERETAPAAAATA